MTGYLNFSQAENNFSQFDNNSWRNVGGISEVLAGDTIIMGFFFENYRFAPAYWLFFNFTTDLILGNMTVTAIDNSNNKIPLKQIRSAFQVSYMSP